MLNWYLYFILYFKYVILVPIKLVALGIDYKYHILSFKNRTYSLLALIIVLSTVLNSTYMDVVMATSGIVLKTIASVRFFFSINHYDIYINSFINNCNDQENLILGKNNVPVIQVRFLQNAIQVTLV